MGDVTYAGYENQLAMSDLFLCAFAECGVVAEGLADTIGCPVFTGCGAIELTNDQQGRGFYLAELIADGLSDKHVRCEGSVPGYSAVFGAEGPAGQDIQHYIVIGSPGTVEVVFEHIFF